MPPKIDLEPYKAWIVAQVEQQLTKKAICDQIYTVHGVTVSPRRLGQSLSLWRVSSNNNRAAFYKTNDVELLRERIAYAFCTSKTTDKATAAMLENDGFHIGPRRIQRIRLELGLKKHINGTKQRKVCTETAQLKNALTPAYPAPLIGATPLGMAESLQEIAQSATNT